MNSIYLDVSKGDVNELSDSMEKIKDGEELENSEGSESYSYEDILGILKSKS